MKWSFYNFDWKDKRSQKIFEETTSDFTDERTFTKEANNIIRNFNLKKKYLVLDFGCGIGNHAIRLAKKGYNVNGYDISNYYIKKAKEKAKEQKINMKFFSNKFDFCLHKNKYDFIYTINFPIGYQDKSSDIRLFKKIGSLLKKGEFFLFGFTRTRENIEKYSPRIDWKEKNQVYFIEYEILNKNGGREEKYIIINPKSNSITEWIDKSKSYYGQEIKNMLSNANFKIINCYENLEKKIPKNIENVHFIYCKKN